MKATDWKWTYCFAEKSEIIASQLSLLTVLRITQGSSSSFDVDFFAFFVSFCHHKGKYRAARAAKNVISTPCIAFAECAFSNWSSWCRLPAPGYKVLCNPAPGYKNLVAGSGCNPGKAENSKVDFKGQFAFYLFPSSASVESPSCVSCVSYTICVRKISRMYFVRVSHTLCSI